MDYCLTVCGYRDIKYLIEFSNENTNILLSAGCKVALKQDVPGGLFVNPDQIADLIRLRKVVRCMVVFQVIFVLDFSSY